MPKKRGRTFEYEMIGLLRKLCHQGIAAAMQRDLTSRVVASFLIDADKRRNIAVLGNKMAFWISSSMVNRYFLSESGGVMRFQRKEADTLEFLRTNLRDDDVFYDIGANIGIYVVLAMKFAALRHVVALEPEALNYAELCRNIWTNGLDRTTALCVGASDKEGYESYYLKRFAAGNHSGRTSRYSAGVPAGTGRVDDGFVHNYSQKIHLLPLDLLIDRAELPIPNVLLMDIDGGEINALGGMAETLARPALRALAIEWAPFTRDAVRDIVEHHGFAYQGGGDDGRSNAFFLRG